MQNNFLPRSIGGRFLLSSIIILCIVQIASLLAFYYDSQRTKHEFNNRMLTLRIATIVNTIDKLEPASYQDYINSQHNPGLYFFASTLPVATPDVSQGSNLNNTIQQISSELTNPDRSISLSNSIDNTQAEVATNSCLSHPSIKNGKRIKRMCTKLKENINEHAMSYVGSIKLKNETFLNFIAFKAPKNELHLGSFYLLSLLILTLAGSTALYALVKITVKPLNKLTEQTTKLSQNYKSEPLKEEGATEIQNLIQSFNRMQKKLADFISDRTRILASISHDLKTPLTSMALRAEFLPDSEDKNKLINNIETMTAMVKATLQFARSDEATTVDTPLNLPEFLQDIVSEYQDNGYKVSYSEDGNLGITNNFICSVTDMRRIIQNLTDNALSYGTLAKIHLWSDGKEIKISFTDDGPGIPPEKLEDVFAPFMRLDKARNTTEGHVGLGLSIVRNTILKQGGKIILENIRPHGLKAVVIYSR